MKNYITRHAYERAPIPAQGDMPEGYPRPNSVPVAYNRAPAGLCAANAPAKRAVHRVKGLSVAKRQGPPDDFDVVVSGTIVLSSFSQSYCATSKQMSTSSASARVVTSGSVVETFTNLPTLPAVSYCTEILTNGREVLHSKTGSCTYNTVEPTISTSPLPAPTTNTDGGNLTCGARSDQGKAEYWFTLGDLSHARDQFCSNMTNNVPPIVFESGGDNHKVGYYTAPDNADFPIRVSATWTSLDNTKCKTFDFSQNEDGVMYKLCQKALGIPINDCK